MRKRGLLYGVGINDAGYPVDIRDCIDGKRTLIWKCPYYSRWSGMLRRAYSEEYILKKPSYEDCTVCEEWFTFSNFRAWMETQDWEGKHLDKDILVPGNKHYSPDTCVFVTGSVNAFILDHARARGEWPIGVSLYKPTGKYKSTVNDPSTGKQLHLGFFASPEQAHQAWKKRKHELACQLADLQTDQRVAEALRIRYK